MPRFKQASGTVVDSPPPQESPQTTYAGRAARATPRSVGSSFSLTVELPSHSVNAVTSPELCALLASSASLAQSLASVNTDKARYNPGQSVGFTANIAAYTSGLSLVVQYYQGGNVLSSQTITRSNAYTRSRKSAHPLS